MTSAFLQKLVARCDRLTGVVPNLHGRLEAVAAVYPRRCHAIALEAFTKSHRAVCEFAEACLRERAVQLFEISLQDAFNFANWNFPEDNCKRTGST